jgi:uncharacterized protein (UPF0248 family)
MIPIHALIARILHDPEYGRGHWEISYLDRSRPDLVRVPLAHVHTRHHIGFVFDVVDEDGAERSIPYHRVRIVWHDGKMVWSRMGKRPVKRIADKPPAVRRHVSPPRIRRR